MPLKKDLAELLAHNVISLTTARDIERYYDSKKQPAGNLLLTIFGIAGSALAGLGIILIFAHNWDAFTKPVKTGLAFLPLVLSQAFAAWCIIKKKGPAFKESAATLLFFSVGAAISLVAQIYNLPGDMPTFLCTWTLLCLPLVYVLDSQMCALLTILFATWYTGSGPYGSHNIPYMYMVLVGLVLPYYITSYKKQPDSNFVNFFGWALPLSLMVVLNTFAEGITLFYLALYMVMGCLLYNAGRLPVLAKNPRAAYGYRTVGLLSIVTVLFTGSFHLVWEVALYDGIAGDRSLIVWGILFVAAVVAAGAAWQKGQKPDMVSWITVLFPAIYLSVLIHHALPAILCNVLLLILSVVTINRGIAQYNFGTLNLGLGLLAILVACRFFDLEISFALRGLMFLVVGTGFFVANLILAKRKKTQTLNTIHNEN
ncbi:hypothetical protein AM493_13475 [Flavobacterium akiainvivens]|uniref:DUF2157 domain-containing protein n=1 Tax=Flavobacterium akiainvivens TaxID=1202724 RepID=A0A0M8MJN5_9FLAO|nr:DUF2157 domain-containing protein [Flavobacterium akiainvivens]KOS06928.1 hypothetical protein AM493_13475 [Flavobacterium akiainvivens]SFQ69905.1 Uncharacterized membrane protein [Flavobacterium akiainvivens]